MDHFSDPQSLIIQGFEEQILLIDLFEEKPIGFDPIILRGVRN